MNDIYTVILIIVTIGTTIYIISGNGSKKKEMLVIRLVSGLKV